MADSYGFGSTFTASGNDVQKVSVQGFAGNALSGILEALQKQQSLIDNLNANTKENGSRISRLADEQADAEAAARSQFNKQEQERESDLQKSVAAERKQRAANAAVFGKIDKATSAIEVLKDTLGKALDKVCGLLKDGFKKSLQTYDDFSSEMRKMNISHEDKLKAQSAADRANIADGLTVSKDSVVKALTGAASKNNAYFQKLINSDSKESALRMNLMGAMQEQGFDEDTIMKIITNTSDKDLKGLESLILKTSDPMSKAAAMESIRALVSGDFESISKDVVGELTSVVDATRQVSALGSNMSEKTISSFVKLSQDIKSGNIQNANDLNTLSAALGVVGDNLNDPKKLFGALENKLSALDNLSKTDPVAAKAQADALINELRPVLNASNMDKDAIHEFMQSINQAASGELARQSIKTEDTLREMNKDNTVDGKLNEFVGNLTSKFNVFTEDVFGLKGGLFGKLSVNLDELFGGGAPLEDVVSGGFAATIDILKSIRLGQIMNSIGSFFKGGFGGKLTGMGSKLTGVLTKMGPILLKAGAVGVAAASVGYAAYKITEAYNKLSKPDEVKQEMSENNKKIQAAENELEMAKRYGTSEEIAKIEQKLASLKAKGESLKADLQQANEDAKSESEKASDEYSKKQTEVMKGFIDEANVAQRFAMRARQAGDEETYKKEMERHDALMKKADEVRDQMRVVDETSRGLLASTFDLEPETMLAWGTFCNDVSDFFSKDIPDFFSSIPDKIGDLRQRAINAVAKFCGDAEKWVSTNITGPIYAFKDRVGNWVSTNIVTPVINFKDSVGSWVSDNIVTPFIDFKDSVGSWLSDNIINPFIEFKDTVGGWISDNVVNPLISFKDTVGGFIKDKFVDPLHNFFQFDWLPSPIKKVLGINGSSEGSSEEDKGLVESAKETAVEVIDAAKETAKSTVNKIANFAKEAPAKLVDGLTSFFKFYEDGGVVSSATPAIVGEAGKEIILPLTSGDHMREVLSTLSPREKLGLLKELLHAGQSPSLDLMSDLLYKVLTSKSSPSPDMTNSILASLPTSSVPGDDQATINKILDYAGPARGLVYDRLMHGWKGTYKDGFKQRKKWYDEALQNAANQEGRDMIRGTYAERALDYGVSELGKPYILRSLGKIGYVCNELVNAAIQASGFKMGKFRVNGVKATFANIQKGKMSGEGYPNFRIRDDLTPQTAIPGMVFFQDARKNQEGGFQPGHIGLVYYGHQKLHAAGGSANYTKEGFLPNWQTPCRGVTVTPFDGSNYVIGEFPGLFEQASGEWKPPVSSPVPFGPTPSDSQLQNNISSSVKKAGLLSDAELNELAKEAGLQNASAMTEFVKQAEILLNSNNTDKDSIVTILLDIAKYLRGAIQSKQPMMSVARPPMSTYGQ